MKVIFLDVDGVLNSEHCFKKEHKRYERTHEIRVDKDLDKRFIKNLKWLVNKTGAKIVLSSSWRGLVKKDKNHYLHKYLEEQGLKIYDYTPNVGLERGIDIQEWLNHHLDVTNIVILDDESDMCHLKEYLVKTKFRSCFKTKKEKYIYLPWLWFFLEGLTKFKCRQAVGVLDKTFINKMKDQVMYNTRKQF